jgi:2-polyprenyl-6-methoxyphenol hydroxylase-like FAD-dependent oxidoreductase
MLPVTVGSLEASVSPTRSPEPDVRVPTHPGWPSITQAGSGLRCQADHELPSKGPLPDHHHPMRVIVVGGGIAGLSAAIALGRTGQEVVVLERAPRVDPLGAGITLFGNAMRALDRLGVGEAVAARGAPAMRSAILTCEGRELTHVPSDLLEGTIALHRADLQAELAAAGGEVRLGAQVTAVEQGDESVVAIAAEGGAERGDLLVGADGLSSVARRAIAEAPIRYAGYTAWRGVSPVPVEPGRLTESWGVGERFGLVDIGRGRTYWFATKNAPEGERDEPDGRKAEIVRRFSGWHEPIAAVAEAADESAILRNDVYYLEPLPGWSSGRVVLVGDAAHATTPGVGQGAAQAIEDAVVLADRLTRGDDLATALAEFEAIRRPRANAVLRMSRRVDKAAQLATPLAWRLRNALVRRLPERAQRRQLGPLVRYEL